MSIYALLPTHAFSVQAERLAEDGAQLDPPGMHLQPLPFADEVRAAPVERAFQGTYAGLAW